MTDLGIGVVRPLPGNGLVAHMGGLLLVCDAADAAGADLLEALRETAASGGDGRALARRAAQVLARTMTGDPASCAVAGPVGDGVAVLVSGSATAVVAAGDGELRLSGSDSLTWADRLVSGPVRRVELSLPGAGQAHPAVRLDGGVVVGGGILCDLTESAPPPAPVPLRPLTGDRQQPQERQPRERQPQERQPQERQPQERQPQERQPQLQDRPLTSEMPNTAFHIDPDLVPPRQEPVVEQPPVNPAPYPLQGPPSGPQPGPFQQPGPPPQSGPHQQHPHEVRQGPPSEPIPHLGPGGPASGPLSAVPPYEEPHQGGNGTAPDHGPFEPQPSSPFEPQGEQDQRPMVYGVDCKNDHFNDPRLPYCATCGIALVQRTLVPYKGPRPSLGVLVLDDGAALPLEADYLLGRDPERAPEVTGGSARPAKVTSPDGSVSRRHLRVALDGWDVNLVDLGSVNGTQIQPPGDPNFYDIPPNEPVTIAPGTTVRIGVSRTMRFEPQR
ncbi:FHA domain-containing protein [Nonomuraea sp. NPDC050556]|uniref:FHA domain-containing protein n=1 Tax=Nonomuraea sp. NPDC050556 TaxID=3364369 RepID=UPI0037B9CAC3